MKYIFLALFALTSAIHLYHSWEDKGSHRAKTKPFLLFFLILFYLASTDKINFMLIFALLTSWLGDILLIPKGNKWFVMGGISFMISHFFFILTYLPGIDFAKVKWAIAVPMAAVYFGISLAVIKAIKPSAPKSMHFPLCFYLLCNSAMNLFALMQLMSKGSAASVMAVLGALLFFASDCCLFLLRYHRRPDIIFRKHFTVMITYLAGEFLIVLGILGL